MFLICLLKCSFSPRRKFSPLCGNIQVMSSKVAFAKTMARCRMHGETLLWHPPPLPHLVDGSSNHHDWLTFRQVPFSGIYSFHWIDPCPPVPAPPTLLQTLPSRERPDKELPCRDAAASGGRGHLSMSEPL